MLDVRLSLFDQTLHNLVCHHHVRHSESHCGQSILSCIDVALQLKAKGQGLLKEVQAQVWVLS